MLTDQQRRVLDLVRSWVAEHGWPPTLREICGELNVASPQTARDHLLALERKGYIFRGRGSRALRVLF
jgi:repressor LexA